MFHLSFESTSSASSNDIYSSSQELSFGLSDDEGTGEEIVTALPVVFEDSDSTSPSAAVSATTSNVLTGLHDTGATHCMFKDKQLFDSSSLVTVEDKSKRVKLAGGDMSLAIHSRGVVKLKSGDGTPFSIKNSHFMNSDFFSSDHG